ncbi:hypothetical protein [Pseudochelatococcus sp. G4_1912]|uniref:hypothetical protein n=1 Tax=Pseudochelatococcus sp. G4_1912 TaxID=3114288 RepID=UPI0039C6A91A
MSLAGKDVNFQCYENNVDLNPETQKFLLADNKSDEGSVFSIRANSPILVAAAHVIDTALEASPDVQGRTVAVVDKKQALAALYVQVIKSNLKAGSLVNLSPRSPYEMRRLAAQFNKHANEFSRDPHVLSALLLRLANIQERVLIGSDVSELSSRFGFVSAMLDLMIFKDMFACDMWDALKAQTPELSQDAFDDLIICLMEIERFEKTVKNGKNELHLKLIEEELHKLESGAASHVNNFSAEKSAESVILNDMASKLEFLEIIIKVPHDINEINGKNSLFLLLGVVNFIISCKEKDVQASDMFINIDTLVAYKHSLIINMIRAAGIGIETMS